ncbi:MAG: tripartite tricarboxylate transporter permease [Anaerotruncus sp.]|nr:tripartite tricarboxylate transporter permease [Anaerotruncus sp.]
MIINGILSIINPTCLLLILGGVIMGIIFGALPGLTSTMGVALCLPLTFSMNTIQSLSLLIGVYVGGISGGLISAILLKIPGTPSSIATTFDGGPMAERGEAGKALSVGLFYSFLGTMFGVALMIFMAPSIAQITIKFSCYEYFAIGVFSLTMVGSLVSGNPLKGLASCVVGLCLAMVGLAPVSSTLRYTYGNHNLDSGFALLAVMVGLFAVADILTSAKEGFEEDKGSIRKDYKLQGIGVSRKEFIQQLPNAFRSALIGMGIGILPGIGGGTSNMIAYAVAKNASNRPEKFGTGCIDGIIASETSNNAGIGGALITLLTLGIPGDTVTAMMLSAFMMHGLSTGPMLFKTDGVLVYGIFAAVVLATVFMFLVEYGFMAGFVRILAIPRYILLPVIVVLCVIGTFGNNNRVFDVWTVLIFGLIGFAMKELGFSLSPMILGFILESTIETNLIRGLQLSKNNWMAFFTRPISVVFYLLAIVSIVMALRKMIRANKTVGQEERIA